MKQLLILLLLVCAVGNAQQFPGAIATDADLLVAHNAAETTLSAGINNSVTTFTVASGTSFGNNMMVLIDVEAIFCTTLTSNTFSGCTRAFDGTSAAAHSSGASVTGIWAAKHHNALADEVKAIETALGVNLGNVGGSEILSTTDTTIDIASMNDGACSATETVTLAGAALGEAVTVVALTDVLADAVYIFAKVTSADTVEYFLCNLSGGADDPAATDFKVQLVRP